MNQEVVWEDAGGGGAVRVVFVPGLEAVRFEIEDGNASPGPMCGKGCPGEQEAFDFTTDRQGARQLVEKLAPLVGLQLVEQGASPFQDVLAFHRACGLVIGAKPAFLPGRAAAALDIASWTDLVAAKTKALAINAGNADGFARRMRLIAEELDELVEAHNDGDLPAFADALADLVWVTIGTAVEAGIPFDAVWAEVRRANLAKAGGKLDASGKLQKPAGWCPPDVAGVIARAGAP